MIGHQTIGIAEPVKALGDLGKSIQKKASGRHRPERWASVRCPGGDVVKRAVVYVPCRQKYRIKSEISRVKT